MKLTPLVSVCVPTYNGEKYIKEAIDSIILQDYKNLEVIISDDHSNDKTIEIAQSLLEKSSIPFKILIHHPSGIGSNWNHSIKNAKGKYIKLLFQDDVLHADCIQKMVSALENNETAGMVFSKRTILYEPSPENELWLNRFRVLHNQWGFILKEGLVSGKKLLGSSKLLDQPKNKIGEPPTTLIRKDCFDTIGYFDNNLVQALDLEFWYRIMAKYDLVFIDEELVSFRLHEEQQSSTNRNLEIKDFERLPFILFKKYFWHLNNKVKKQIFREMLAITKKKLQNK